MAITKKKPAKKAAPKKVAAKKTSSKFSEKETGKFLKSVTFNVYEKGVALSEDVDLNIDQLLSIRRIVEKHLKEAISITAISSLFGAMVGKVGQNGKIVLPMGIGKSGSIKKVPAKKAATKKVNKTQINEKWPLLKAIPVDIYSKEAKRSRKK